MNCLILGGYGNTGRLIADYLLQETPQVNIFLGGRHLEKAQQLAAEFRQRFSDAQVEAVQVDAADKESLKRAFRNMDLVIAASSTADYTENIARAALEIGTDYLDVQYSTAKVRTLNALRREIESSGCCFITEGGFHPGLPAAMIRYAAGHFDCLESALVGSVIQVDWKAADIGSATAEEFSHELLHFDTTVYKGGQWVSLGWTGSHTFEFGGAFGQQKAIAMMLEELRPLPSLIPDLKETGFYVGGFNSVVDNVMMPLGYLLLKAAPRRGVKIFSKMLMWGLKTFSRPPYSTILKLDAQGIKDGQPHTFTLRIEHEDGYVMTAVPVVACLLQYLDSSIRKPGLWMQGLVVEPERLFTDMQRMGVQVECV